MQEIKFRAKRKETKEWVEGFYYNIQNIDHYILAPCVLGVEHIEVDPDTVGQYTGLKAMYGKEVFKGDLLRFEAEGEWPNDNCVLYEVFFHDGDECDSHIGWQMNRTHFQGAICGTDTIPNMTPRQVAMMYVAGNIWDNPELIKQ